MRIEGRIIGALLVGFGLAYLLDPDRGSRRRALMRDRAIRVGRKLTEELDAASKELRNRATGTAAELRARFRQEDVDDVAELVNEPEVRAADSVPLLQGRRPRVRGRARRRGVEVQKVINVAAPIEEVWELWSNYENFPRFMAHLEEVRRTGEGQSHWVAVGPAGVKVAWDAVTTAWVPNELIGWESVEGATVENSGMVRFKPTTDGGTQIDVRMSYSPPGGAAGHAVASLFGTDPKGAMDEDMVRLKSLLEEGKTSTDQGTVELEEVATSQAKRTARRR